MPANQSPASASEFEAIEPTRSVASSELLTRTAPFNPSVLDRTGLDAHAVTSIELGSGSELYGLVCSYLAKNAQTRNFTCDIGGKKSSGCCGGEDDETMQRTACKDLGLGLFEFACEVEGATRRFFALHQTLGEVVGSDCGATLLRNLILISPGPSDVELLTGFCDDLIAKADATEEFKFTTYRFHVQYQYWRRSEVVAARPIDSVVLPEKTKQRLISDLDDFVSAGTRAWFLSHGIPYKRSYLLHGAPGAGKTSVIQAIAGRYKRNVCYLSPSHPDMTDDALKAAVTKCPQKSLIVLEDVDSLFSEGRKKKEGDRSALTFSGVLNALDGVGGSTGQIFILTTNHRENLDPALIRNGRVDCHIEFSDANDEQMRGLFRQFYPGAEAGLAEKFAAALLALLEGKGAERGCPSVSMAQLQHYFVAMRRESAEAAAEGVEKILEEAEAHGKLAKETETEKAAGEEAEADGGKEKGEKKEKDAAKAAAPVAAAGGGKEVHVHVHMHN